MNLGYFLSFVYFLRLLFWGMVALLVLHILFFPYVHAGGEPGIIFVFCLFSQTLILGNGGSFCITYSLFSGCPCWGWGGGHGIFFVFCLFYHIPLLSNSNLPTNIILFYFVFPGWGQPQDLFCLLFIFSGSDSEPWWLS
jgi:hypothetical protein